MCAAAGMRGFLTKPATVFSLDAAHFAKRRRAGAVGGVDRIIDSDRQTGTDEETLNSLADLESRAAEPFLERLIARFLQGLPDDVAAVRSQWKRAMPAPLRPAPMRRRRCVCGRRKCPGLRSAQRLRRTG